MNYEVIGIIATVLIIVSFLANGERKIRMLNIAGSVLFVLYGALTHTYSTTVLNGALIIVHIIKLRKGC